MPTHFFRLRRALRERWPLVRVIGTAAGFSLVLATSAVAAIAVEAVHARALGLPNMTDYVNGLPHGVLQLNLAVFVAIGLLVYAASHSYVVASASVAGIGLLASYSHLQKMRIRGEPLYPADVVFLRELGFLVGQVGSSTVVLLGATLGSMAALITLWVVLRRRLDPTSGWRERVISRRNLPVRVGSAVIGVVALVTLASFHDDANRAKQAYDASGADWLTWSQVENYRVNGFTAAFLYNLPGPVMEEPPTYSRQSVADTLSRWESRAQELNVGRDPHVLDEMNVIIVLSESLADPLLWQGLAFAEDPLPFARSMMSSTLSGSMLSSGYGGGTANVEWEALTGFTVREFAPQMRTPFQQLIPFLDTYATHFDRFGKDSTRATVAVHPYLGSFYQRSRVYPILGFDRADFIETFDDDRIDAGPYIADRAAYVRAIDILRANPAPVSMNILTMQNHSPYAGVYDDPIAVSGAGTDAERAELGHYARGLAHSDEALRDFVRALDSLDEPTLLIVYGDHLPSILPGDVLASMSPQRQYETPWFVWSSEPLRRVSLPPTVGPNHLVSIAFDAVGAPLSPLDALLHDLLAVSPARTPGLTLDSDGALIDPSELPPESELIIADYVLLQYDASVGERFGDRRLYSPVIGASN